MKRNMKKLYFLMITLSVLVSGTDLFGMWGKKTVPVTHAPPSAAPSYYGSPGYSGYPSYTAPAHTGNYSGNYYGTGDMKGAVQPAQTQKTDPKAKKAKKPKKTVVLPTIDDNSDSFDRYEILLLLLLPQVLEVIATDDASVARVKSCTDCGGKCPSCSGADRAGSKCTSTDMLFAELDERYFRECDKSYTQIAGNTAFDWATVEEVVREWETKALEDTGGETGVQEEGWEMFEPVLRLDIVEQWELCSHCVTKDRVTMTEATMREDARLAIDLLKEMFQDYLTRNKLDPSTRESVKRTLQTYVEKPKIVRNMAMQAVINENLRRAGHIKEPLAERLVTVLQEVGIVMGAATGAAGVIVQWYKSLTSAQVASMLVSTGVSIFAPGAKMLKAAVISFNAARELADLSI